MWSKSTLHFPIYFYFLNQSIGSQSHWMSRRERCVWLCAQEDGLVWDLKHKVYDLGLTLGLLMLTWDLTEDKEFLVTCWTTTFSLPTGAGLSLHTWERAVLVLNTFQHKSNDLGEKVDCWVLFTGHQRFPGHVIQMLSVCGFEPSSHRAAGWSHSSSKLFLRKLDWTY